MLKFIHTGDWHLGHELSSFNRTAEQRDMLRSIASIVEREQPDALLICGDVFHTATPSNAAMTMLADELDNIRSAAPRMKIIMIAGNHDSGSRLEIMRAPWRHLGIEVVGRVIRDPESGAIDFSRHIITLMDKETGQKKGVIAALPHIFDRGYPPIDDTPGDSAFQKQRFLTRLNSLVEAEAEDEVPVVALAHLAIEGCEWRGHDRVASASANEHDIIGGLESVARDKFPLEADYLALGHIHCPQIFRSPSGATASYSGSPLAVSFDEDYPHSVNIVTIEGRGSTPEIKRVEITPRFPLVTIPEAGEPPYSFPEALEAITSYPDEAYLRVRVLIDGLPPAGAVEQAAKASAASPARFCKFLWERPKADSTSDRALPSVADLDTFRQLDPLEVAERYYTSRNGEIMPPELRTILSDVIKQVRNSNL